jgi:hypothetical protein
MCIEFGIERCAHATLAPSLQLVAAATAQQHLQLLLCLLPSSTHGMPTCITIIVINFRIIFCA